MAVVSLHCRTLQGLAVTDQVLQTCCATWDLADQPGLEHLSELLQVGLIEQVEEGRIRRPTLEVQTHGSGSGPPGTA